MSANTDRMVAMIDAAVVGSAPFLPVGSWSSRSSPTRPRSFRPSPSFSTKLRSRSRNSTPTDSRERRTSTTSTSRAVDAGSGSAVARQSVQYDVPDRSGRDSLQVPEGQHVDPYEVHSARTTSRATRSRSSPSRKRRSATSAVRSAMTGCFPRPSASSRRMARRCWCASRPTWTRGALPSR